ncbi:ISL3 family transposase [Babesia caballi]|uniref:ISL3 family transposase n=1 Tax=Babesia caballi TaxID=5871 RepID=A0AAV4LND4_BABCB|nr:ISL3 family transposase [Babesia caballi]
MGSVLRAELLDALRARFGAVVRSAELRSCKASFADGAKVHRTAELYRYFNLSNVNIASVDEVRAVLDSDFVETVQLLEASSPGTLRLLEIYPLLRRILILIEGYLGQVSKSSRFEGTLVKVHGASLPDVTLFVVLDELYDEACGSQMSNDRLLAGLSALPVPGDSSLESVLLSASAFANIVVPFIAHSFEYLPDDALEMALATFTFGLLQRFSALFLLLVVVDSSLRAAEPPNACTSQPVVSLSGDDNALDNMSRLYFLCDETLRKSLLSKLSDQYLGVCWQEDVVLPVLRMLQYTFVACGKIASVQEPLADLVLSTTTGFLTKVPEDCALSRSTMDCILAFGRQFLGMFCQGVERLNAALWAHFDSRLSHVLKLQQQAASSRSDPNLSLQGSIYGSKSTGNTQNSPKSPGTPLTQPMGRSLTTLLSEGEVKSTLTAFNSSLQYYERHHKELFNIMLGSYSRKVDVELVDCVSRLFVQYTALVQLNDAVVYITQRSPNVEVCELMKLSITVFWNVLRELCQQLSFGVLKASFYDLGSEFHSCNVAAQICCFNAAIGDHNSLKQSYDTNADEYVSKVGMLCEVLRNASTACCTCVSYGPSKHRRSGSRYLSVSSAFVARWFVMEVTSRDVCEPRGLVDAFIAWCHSDRVEEYLLARFLCRVVTQLCRDDPKFTDGGRYVLDVLLGVCLHNDRPSDSLRGVLRPISPAQRNAFRCLRVFLHNGIFAQWLLRHVVMPYTCVFVRYVVEHVTAFLGQSSVMPQLSFECYFAAQRTECRCMDAPVVSSAPALLQYLELVASLPLESADQGCSEGVVKMLQHMFAVLSGLLVKLVQLLHTHQTYGELESRFALFVLSARLTYVLVHSGQFGRSDVHVVTLLKLFSLLGNPQICMFDNVDMYLSLILEALCVFHAIFDHVPVQEQLLKLHRGFITLLFSKMGSHPSLLLRHELYIGVPRSLFDQLSGYFAGMLAKARSLGFYLSGLYSFRLWSVLRRYNVDRDDVKSEYAEPSLASSDDPPELRITINAAFLTACRLPAVASSASASGSLGAREMVEQGSSIALCNKL